MRRNRDDDNEHPHDPRLGTTTQHQWNGMKAEACFPLCQHPKHNFDKGFDPYPKAVKSVPKP